MLRHFPDDRLPELLNYARFLMDRADEEAWQDFGRTQFAKAYREEDPDYAVPSTMNEMPSAASADTAAAGRIIVPSANVRNENRPAR